MIKYATLTNKGNREVNEDSIGVETHNGMNCFVLCDGLGGHGMGDIASSLVRDVFVDQFSKTDDPASFIGKTFMIAQDFLLAEQIERRARNKMKTTCVALVTDEITARIGHVGDSRLYIFRRNKVKKRTLDHSIPQMLVLAHEIKESEIRNHPERSTVMRSMGVEWETPQFELMEPIPLKKCQAFLLCSDGFWELIDEKQMCELLKQTASPEEWLKEMESVVKANGIDRNMDNYSAIAVWNT